MKYELIPEGELFRLRALKEFCGIPAGSLGGLVQGPNNLSQFGDCWVFDEAKVLGISRVGGNAWVCGNAVVSNDAYVYGNAVVDTCAHIGGSAIVYGWGVVTDHGHISGYAAVGERGTVSGYASIIESACVLGGVASVGTIGGTSLVTKTPLVVSGPGYELIITDDTFIIGNKCKLISELDGADYELYCKLKAIR